MTSSTIPRRRFVTGAGALAGLGIASANGIARGFLGSAFLLEDQAVDYTLHIKTSAIEIAPKRIISAVTYNGQFPGPLLRFEEGRQVTVDIYNDTDTPEQLHWHGQKSQSRWMELPRRAHHSFLRMVSDELHSHQTHICETRCNGCFGAGFSSLVN